MAVVANRYARALLEALCQDNSPGPDAGHEQLIQIRQLLDTEPDARKLLVNPVIPPERRDQFLSEIGQALGLDGRVLRLLAMIVERRRLNILNDLIDNYQKMLDERNGIVRALVTSAAPLSEAEQRDIALRLEKSLGQRVVMDVREDPTLIGGLVVRIGSTVYDGSLRQHLEGFRERLLAS
jgi:F-type H+-transporting ATPase subunit delta